MLCGCGASRPGLPLPSPAQTCTASHRPRLPHTVFVHQSAVQSTGFRFLREGERIAFDLVDTDRGVQAANVTGPEGQQLNRAREHDDKFDLSKLE